MAPGAVGGWSGRARCFLAAVVDPRLGRGSRSHPFRAMWRPRRRRSVTSRTWPAQGSIGSPSTRAGFLPARTLAGDLCPRVFRRPRSARRSPSIRSTLLSRRKRTIMIAGCRSSRRCCGRSWLSLRRTRGSRRLSGDTESSVTLAKASAARTKANRADLEGIVTRTLDSASFNAWFTAFAARSYDAQADAAFAEGSNAGSTADKYIRDTVFLATVLFLVGISAPKRRSRRRDRPVPCTPTRPRWAAPCPPSARRLRRPRRRRG